MCHIICTGGGGGGGGGFTRAAGNNGGGGGGGGSSAITRMTLPLFYCQMFYMLASEQVDKEYHLEEVQRVVQ